MSKIEKTYTTAVAARYPGRYRIARIHIVECESWPPMNLPVAAKKALCGVATADPRHTKAPLSSATCPKCQSQHRIRLCAACASGTGRHTCGLKGLQAMLPMGGK